ncbi:MAG TPA: trehalose-phosphatase [Phycisphaerales bacterium]|nr:trehalose-phosphatase [Phycisphaerales bacterium]
MLDLALRTAASTARLLVATDFDGTIAPLHTDPQSVLPEPTAVAALTTLCRSPDTQVCVISGRCLTSLWRCMPPISGLVLRGSYGEEVHAPAARSSHAQTLDDLHTRLAGAIQGTSARLERKSLGIAVHTRGVSRQQALAAATAARRAAAGLHGISARAGLDVVDFTLVQSDKADALRQEIDLFQPTAVLVMGDDDEDERMFIHAQPDPVTVRVGSGFTRAEFRLESPARAAAALARLSELRAWWATERV